MLTAFPPTSLPIFDPPSHTNSSRWSMRRKPFLVQPPPDKGVKKTHRLRPPK